MNYLNTLNDPTHDINSLITKHRTLTLDVLIWTAFAYDYFDITDTGYLINHRFISHRTKPFYSTTTIGKHPEDEKKYLKTPKYLLKVRRPLFVRIKLYVRV